jgi:hypothetical protein
MDELEQIARRYLLGELSEQEQVALEQKYFGDPRVFKQVLQVESELVDAYARGQLTTEIRERFENSYLKHDARRQRVEFAKAFTTSIDEREAARNKFSQATTNIPWWRGLLGMLGGERPTLRLAVAVVAVLVVLSGAWMVVNNLRRRQQPAPIQAKRENDEPRKQQPSPQTQQEQVEHTAQVPPATSQASPSPVTKPAPTIVSLALTVGGVRGSGSGATQTLFIPAETTNAEIFLNLKDDNYPHYRASLQRIGGPEIFVQTNIRPRSSKAGARFVFTVPARQLTNGDYALTLSGITAQGEVEDLSKSLFRVEKK